MTTTPPSTPTIVTRTPVATWLLMRPLAAVVAAYALSAAFLVNYAAGITSYIWLIDEMLYEKGAVGFTRGAVFLPEVHGTRFGPPNGLYPLLLSPAYALLSAPHAFAAAHVINALAFASVLFPVYLLARRLGVGWGWALFAGVLSVWVPWSVATLVVMTESVAYPAFVWAILAITIAISEPSPKRDFVALLAIGVAIYARTQLVILVAVLIFGIVAQEFAIREGSSRRRLRPHLPLAIALAVGAIATIGLGQVAGDVLGAYGATLRLPPFPAGLWGSMAVHLAHLVIGVGILPVILWLAWLARVALNPLGGIERPHAIVSALAFAATIYQAGFYAQNVAGGTLQERYAFYVIPLFMIGMVAVVADARRLPPRLSAIAAGLAVALIIGGASYDPAEAGDAFGRVAAAGAGFNKVLAGQTSRITRALLGEPRRTTDVLAIVAVGLSVLAVAVLASRHRRLLAPTLCGLVLVFCAAETRWLLKNEVPEINATFVAAVPGALDAPRDWIDRALPQGKAAALIPGRLGVPDEASAWLWTEFWNDDVTRAYQLGDRPNYSAFPTLPLRLDERTGRVSAPEELPYLVVSLADPTLRIRGEVVSRSPYGAAVLRPERPYHAAFVVTGGYFDGFSRGTATQIVSVYPRAARARSTPVRLTLEAAPTGPRRVPFELRSGTRTRRGVLRAGAVRRLLVPAEPRDAGARSTIEVVAKAASKLPDGRRVGLRIAAVDPL